MARAEPALAPGEGGLVREAGEAMLLMVNRALWETLIRQAKAEGRHPGAILDAALKLYLEEHGSDEAVAYLHKLAGTPGASEDVA